jgi:dTDP-4-amino-4,6-dideoxygalactose transaminase
MKASLPPCVLDLPEIVFTTSGRAAIALALRDLGVGRDSAVLIPTYHCTTMVAPAVAAGAQPVFYPITRYGAPDLQALEEMDITGVKVMIAAHFFGIPQPLRGVREFCDRRGIALIEDCAHALFGIADGEPVGTWGDLAISSLTKFYPVPVGGCLISARRTLSHLTLDTQGWVAELKCLGHAVESGTEFSKFTGLNAFLSLLLSLTGRVRTEQGSNGSSSGATNRTGARNFMADLDHQLIDCRPTRVCLGIVRMSNRPRIFLRRRENYQRLAEAMHGIKGVRPLVPKLPATAAPYVFPLWVDKPDPLYKAMRETRFPVFRWDWLWPATPHLEGDPGLLWSKHVLQLACHQDLESTDIDWMVQRLNDLMESVS